MGRSRKVWYHTGTELFIQLETHADILREFSHPPAALLCQIVARSIDAKAAILEQDEREQGISATSFRLWGYR